MVRPVVLTVSLAVLVAGCGQGEEAFNKNFHDNFRSSCIETASRNAPSPGVAEQYCDCVLAVVDEKYTAMEKVGLSPEDLTPVMNQCMSKVMAPNG